MTRCDRAGLVSEPEPEPDTWDGSGAVGDSSSQGGVVFPEPWVEEEEVAAAGGRFEEGGGLGAWLLQAPPPEVLEPCMPSEADDDEGPGAVPPLPPTPTPPSEAECRLLLDG